MIKIEDVLRELPFELQDEVRDFIQSLVEKKVLRKQARLRMTWAGGLREFRDQFTSLELQKKSLGWWGD